MRSKDSRNRARPKFRAGKGPGWQGGAIGAVVGLAGAAAFVVPATLHGGRTHTAQQAAATDQVAGAPGDPGTLAAKLTKRLGTRTAGSYLDRATGRVVVTVTNSTDAQTVQAAGAEAKQVAHSGAELRSAATTLRQAVTAPGTGWAVDPASNKMVVWADSTITGARLTAVRTAARSLGDMVRLERIPGRLTTRAAGGDAIFGGGARCSLGFNVRSGDSFFFLTAGHCGNIADSWSADQAGADVLGTTEQSSFPGNDFAIVRYADGVAEPPGEVTLGGGDTQDITSAADPVVGQTVQRSGSTSGVHSGQVTALNATVNYPEGTVTGLIDTTVCAEPGDSGGPLFSGTTALGLTSGGSGDCESGGETFFQPVSEPLSVFGVDVY